MAEKNMKSGVQARAERKISRGMPNNVEAEASVLGSALIDGKAADTVIPMLKSSDFYLVNNRTVFEAMQYLLERGKPIDTVAVADRLETLGKLNEIGVDYLSGLSQAVPSAANCEYYAEIIKRDALTRRVIEAGNEIVKFGYDSDDGQKSLANAEMLVYGIAESNSEKKLIKADEALASAMQGIEDAQAGNLPTNFVYTDFPTLDNKFKGLKPGEMILLAARPSVGKTAFALNIAANSCIKHGKTVAIFSLEMPAELLVKRMLSYVSKVSLTKMSLRSGLTPSDRSSLYAAYKHLLAANLYIDDFSMNTPGDVLSKCRRLKRDAGLDLVIIDYLQLMTTSVNGRSAESRQVEVSTMSRNMKIYAKELDVPILLLSQMSRDVEKKDRTDHKPMLSDLRESGSIEQDADIVMFLHNPSRYNAVLPENQIILDIKKNRNGPIGEIKLEWDGDTTSFKECVDAAEQAENTQPANSTIRDSAPEEETLTDVIDDNAPFKNTKTIFSATGNGYVNLQDRKTVGEENENPDSGYTNIGSGSNGVNGIGNTNSKTDDEVSDDDDEYIDDSDDGTDNIPY